MIVVSTGILVISIAFGVFSAVAGRMSFFMVQFGHLFFGVSERKYKQIVGEMHYNKYRDVLSKMPTFNAASDYVDDEFSKAMLKDKGMMLYKCIVCMTMRIVSIFSLAVAFLCAFIVSQFTSLMLSIVACVLSFFVCVVTGFFTMLFIAKMWGD